MSKYVGNNKQRQRKNERPIEQRSEKVCVNLIKELFSYEVKIIDNVLSDLIDYSKVDVNLEEGLVFTFEERIDDTLVRDLKKQFDSMSISYHFDKTKQKLVIYKE